MRSAAASLLALLVALPATAIDLERIMMPGEVIAGHEDLEADCGKCHQRFDREAQVLLCLDCHDKVADDRSSARGFHGKRSTTREAACAVCHTEHRGRDADILGLDRETFDHGFTDFPLEGAHAALVCGQCHQAGVPFRETASACVDCHAEVEPHEGRLGTECEQCHDTRVWPHVRFDHGPTGFELEGRHEKAACASCHPAERWKDTPSECVTCHRSDDSHRGTFGASCGDCHTPAGWKSRGFDHDRDTDFPLRGAHRSAACQTCHQQDPRKEELPLDCYGCHRADDDHRGANGTDCGACHENASWSKVHFDHDRDTKFPLRGEHRSTRCEACHAGPPREVTTESACLACHESDDVHRGQQGKDCGLCHDPTGWLRARFDHDITRFPLLGLHAVAACEQCHVTQAFRDAETDCVSCHRGDDAHGAALGESCQLCHNPNDWRVWEFDHGLRTRFPLEGSHEGLACDACHVRPAPPGGMRSDCRSCHERDDIHRGGLGDGCGRCHETTQWTEVRVR